MKLERRKFHYQGYYNSALGYPVPCECVLDYVDPIEVEALEKRVEELEKENKRLQALVKKLRCCENCEHRGEPNYVDYECKAFHTKELLKNRCFETREFWAEGK
jgi:hypothetical protein